MENQALTIVEGLLFIVGDEGLTLPQCAAVLDISESEARRVLEDLQRMYAEDQRGIEVVDYGGVFKFVSKASIHPYAQEAVHERQKHGAVAIGAGNLGDYCLQTADYPGGN